jgi:hypothetical protein
MTYLALPGLVISAYLIAKVRANLSATKGTGSSDA